MMEKITVAPMVDRTTEHFRNFIRMFNTKSTLYTEMITAQAIINGDYQKLLNFNEKQHPVVLQLACSDPKLAREAMKKVKDYPYDEINLNAGCPSNRVSDNRMGAYLMSDIQLTKDILSEIKEHTDKPISIKHRIGIDGRGILENDRKIVSYEELLEYIDSINSLGINKFIIHARIAILKGLSPHENRTIPPLSYETVYRVKKDRPNLHIEINGGIKTKEDIQEQLKYVDSVMLGRAVYDNPMLLNEGVPYSEIIEKLIRYVETMQGKPYHALMHTMGLFYATKYSKIWKNVVSNTSVSSKDLKEFLSHMI